MNGTTATIAYRNPDGSFRSQQTLKQEPEDADLLIRKAAELFLPAFEAFLCEIEKGERTNG